MHLSHDTTSPTQLLATCQCAFNKINIYTRRSPLVGNDWYVVKTEVFESKLRVSSCFNVAGAGGSDREPVAYYGRMCAREATIACHLFDMYIFFEASTPLRRILRIIKLRALAGHSAAQFTRKYVYVILMHARDIPVDNLELQSFFVVYPGRQIGLHL